MYSTYLGGSGDDTNSGAIALDDLAEPNAYITGSTNPADFPTTPGAFATVVQGGNDAYIAQIVDVFVPPGPPTARVTGQGTINGSSGTGRFHLIVQRRPDGTLNGKVQYRDPSTSMKSDSVDSLVINGNNATIEGSCGILCTFTVDVTDNGKPGERHVRDLDIEWDDRNKRRRNASDRDILITQ